MYKAVCNANASHHTTHDHKLFKKKEEEKKDKKSKV